MLKIIIDVVAHALILLCELTHWIPEPYDDRLQGLFIDTIGYHCPFSTWGFIISEKYGNDRYKVK